jgi:hypothetical protein
MNETIKYLIWAVLNKDVLAEYEKAQIADLLERYSFELETRERFNAESG